jgi:glycosyltransferase involved in cell wall biosynthesis
MRVLLTNHFPLEGSGSGIYTQNVARELTHKGHDAIVIAPGHEAHSGFPFEVHTILFSPDDPIQDDSSRLPFNFPCFTTHPLSTTTYGDLSAEQRQAYVWVSGYAAHTTGLPYVATAHGTDLMGIRKYKEWKAIALEGAQHAAAIIVISKQVAEDTLSLYDIPAGNIRLVMNGFDESIFRVQTVVQDKILSSYGITGEFEYVVSFVGKLTDFKGVDVLLNAAAIYEQDLGRVLTLIVGDGELRGDLEAQAQRLRLMGVHFLGHQPQPGVAKIYNLADVSTVPSRVEPFGLVAIEAMACGTPVVATNEGGLPDFIHDGVGVLVDVDDAERLAEAIMAEIRSDAKARKGPDAARYALEGFSWSTQVDKMIAVYEESFKQP